MTYQNAWRTQAVVGALALGSLLISAQDAVACRGYRFWPTNETDDRLKPEHIVITARLERAYASLGPDYAIMGSNLDFLYKIEIVSMLKNTIEPTLSAGDRLTVENHGRICEFYRPWWSAKVADIDTSDVRKLVLLKQAETWHVIGGEDRETPAWPSEQ